jgi:NADH-ubiquinone oxidoreductase chain 2
VLNTQISNYSILRLVFLSLIISLLLVINMIDIKSIGSGIFIYNGFMQITANNQIIEMFIYLIGSLIIFSLFISKNNTESSTISLNSTTNWLSNYPLIILFNLIGASCLLSSSDLLFLYISIELQSFSLYILSSLNKNSIPATSAGLKYFLIGGLASCFILLGIGLIYSSTGLTNFESLHMIINTSNSHLNFLPEAKGLIVDTNSYLSILNNSFFDLNVESKFNLWLISGFIFVLVGLLIKLGSAPFHQWAPEVYDQVPTKVTTWLVLIPKLSLLILVFEILNIVITSGNWNTILSDVLVSSVGYPDSITLNSIGSLEFGEGFFKNILVLSSLISLIIGSLLGLSQVRIKRLLAFSAISHLGFLLLSLSINSEISIESFFFYLIQYTFTNLNIFLILLTFGILLDPLSYKNIENNSTLSDNLLNLINLNNIQKINKEEKEEGLDINFISELKGVFEINPILSLSLAVSLLSLGGVPPLIGFFAKQQVLYSAISSGFIFISLIAIIMSVVSAYYYLNVIKISHFYKNEYLQENSSLFYLSMFNTSLIKETNNATSPQETQIISNGVTFVISLLTLIIILFIIKPNLLLNSTHILALNIFYS